MPTRQQDKHPAESYGHRYAVVGGAIMASGVGWAVWNASWPSALGGLAAGGFLLSSGYRTARLAPAVQLLNRAGDHLTRGEFDRATELIDLAEARSGVGRVRRAAGMQRARIALAKADLGSAMTHLDRAVVAPLSFLGRTRAAWARLDARSARAFVAAALGDEVLAREDIRAVVEDDSASTLSLARARLAEAMLIRADRRMLDEHLRRHGRLMLEFLGPRERVLFRVLRRSTSSRSAYRDAAKRGVDAHRDWADAVMPGAGELLDGAAGEEGAAPVLHGGAAPASTRAGFRLSRPVRVLLLWVVLIAAFLAVWQLLEPAGAAGPTPDAVGPPPWPFIALAVAFVFVVFCINNWGARRNSRQLLALARQLEVERSSDARGELARLAAGERYATAASSRLMLGLDDEREGRLEPALEHCEEGLALLDRPERRVQAYDLLLPGLRALRARLLAAGGQEDAAIAALGLLEREHPAYPALESARRSVHLVLAAQRGDFELAARIARSRDDELLVRLHEEELGEIVRLESGESFTAERTSRLCAEIEEHPGVRPWLECVAPEATARLLGVPAVT